MEKFILVGFCLCAFIANGFSADLLINKIKFASVEKANELLSQEDDFTNSWSQFDIDSRMHKKNSTKNELFEFIVQQTRKWTSNEEEKMYSIFKKIDKRIKKQGFKINLPDEIFFIKTSLKEEGGAAGYTRNNYVVLKDNILTKSKSDLEKLIIHELFHILTRNNPKFRKEMYQLIGFKLMNELAYPKKLKDYRITNPDAPQVDSYISVKVDGKSKDCMMILYSNEDYNGGEFFKYLKVGFVSLTGDAVKSIEYKGDQPVIYTFKDLTGFYEQVGKNTQYIIHPEEILAENFVLALLNNTKVPSPILVTKIQQKLQQ